MTDNMKKFGELISTDENVKKELEAAVSGLSKDDKKGFINAAIKVAAKHGSTLTAGDFEPASMKLSDDELDAVAGGGWCGSWFDGECFDWFSGRCGNIFQW